MTLNLLLVLNCLTCCLSCQWWAPHLPVKMYKNGAKVDVCKDINR